MIKSLGHKFLEDFVGDLADIEVTLDLTTIYVTFAMLFRALYAMRGLHYRYFWC